MNKLIAPIDDGGDRYTNLNAFFTRNDTKEVGIEDNEVMENHVFLEMLDQDKSLNNKKIKSDLNLKQKANYHETRLIKDKEPID